MTMECQDQNIPPSFNNVGQNFTFLLKSGYVAIISCFALFRYPLSLVSISILIYLKLMKPVQRLST
jgi:hypothetical protein